MPDAPALPSSQTHRLCFFPHAKSAAIDDSKSVDELIAAQKGVPRGGHVPVPHFVADEVEELREFIRFLYPQSGQDRFKLHRPDVLEMRWTVYERWTGATVQFYAAGDTPRQAVLAARHRLASEQESERTLTPFSLPENPQPIY